MNIPKRFRTAAATTLTLASIAAAGCNDSSPTGLENECEGPSCDPVEVCEAPTDLYQIIEEQYISLKGITVESTNGDLIQVDTPDTWGMVCIDDEHLGYRVVEMIRGPFIYGEPDALVTLQFSPKTTEGGEGSLLIGAPNQATYLEITVQENQKLKNGLPTGKDPKFMVEGFGQSLDMGASNYGKLELPAVFNPEDIITERIPQLLYSKGDSLCE